MKTPAGIAGDRETSYFVGNECAPSTAVANRAPLRQRVVHMPGRIVIEGRLRDSTGVLVELSDEAEWMEWVALAHRWKAITMERAPRDLQALGVSLAFLSWRRAREELQRQHRLASERSAHHWRVVRLLIEVWRVIEELGPQSHVPAIDCVREAMLRLGIGLPK